jgi:hypothetical protein
LNDSSLNNGALGKRPTFPSFHRKKSVFDMARDKGLAPLPLPERSDRGKNAIEASTQLSHPATHRPGTLLLVNADNSFVVPSQQKGLSARW